MTKFLNVDLDLGTQNGIEDLISFLGPRVIVMNKAENFVSVESSENYNLLEEVIRDLIEIIQALPPEGRSIWNQCDYRRFNIGIEAGNKPHAAVFSISSEVVKLLAEIQAEIAVTVYAPVSG